jgi:glycine betaine catabolism B
MSLKDVMKDIEGYQEIVRENEVLSKYGIDYTAQRGQAKQVLDLIHPRKLDLAVSEIIAETASAKTLRLVPAKGYLPPFQAGQYLNLAVKAGGIVTSRDYSISSPPSQTAYYDITVRRVEDGFVSDYLLDSVRAGDAFEAAPPAGNFYYNPLFHGHDLVFLAGGSGVTPFMSMIREAAARGKGPSMHLIYGTRDPSDVIFGDEIALISRRHPWIAWTLVVSDPPQGYKGRTGFITAGLMQEVLGRDHDGKTFYLCGPEAMYAFCRPELAKLGVPDKRVRVEMYGPPKDVTRLPGWPAGMARDKRVKVALSGGRTVTVSACEPLMNALEREGIVMPALCRSGECSLCRTKLLKGEVFQPEGVKLRKSDVQFGYIHPCMAYPLGDIEILLA